MRLLIFLQHFMGLSLTAGFVIHDIHFTRSIVGIDYISAVFLLSLLWFHLLIYFRESKIVNVRDKKAIVLIRRLRVFVIGLTIVAFIAGDFFIHEDIHFFMAKSIQDGCMHTIILVFPEYIFKLIFCFEFGNDG